MKHLGSVLMLTSLLWSGAGWAQGTIFNIRQPVPIQAAPASGAGDQLPPNFIKLPQTRTSSNIIAAPTPDTPAKAPEPQYQQSANESNDAYLNRLNSMAKKSTDDMEMVSKELNEKMKALAPK